MTPAFLGLAQAMLICVLTYEKTCPPVPDQDQSRGLPHHVPLALGAVKRGQDYMEQYQGKVGWLFFALCMGAVFLASSKMLQAVEYHQQFGAD